MWAVDGHPCLWIWDGQGEGTRDFGVVVNIAPATLEAPQCIMKLEYTDEDSSVSGARSEHITRAYSACGWRCGRLGF